MVDCFRMVDYVCRDHFKKPYLSNKQQNDLISLILEKSLNGKINTYKTPFNDYNIMEEKVKREIPEIKEYLGETVHDGIKTEFDPRQLIGIKFIEEWKVKTEPFSFEKKVFAYAPIRYYFPDDDSNFVKPHFRLPFFIIDTLLKKKEINKSDKRMVLFNQIAYEYFFYSNYLPPLDLNKALSVCDSVKENVNSEQFTLIKYGSEYLNEIGIYRFMELLFKKARTGEIHSYDFVTDQKLSQDEIKANLGYTEKRKIENVETGLYEDRIIETIYDIWEYKSVIFLEKWYMDSETLRMYKKVVGIAPVRYYYRENDENKTEPVRRIAFKIYFDEKEKF